jgi:protein kinase A
MPMLGGLLRKKRKDSSSAKDCTPPTSPIAESPPATTIEALQTTVRTSGDIHGQETDVREGTKSPMNPAVSQLHQSGASSALQQQHQNVASINNIINSPQSEAVYTSQGVGGGHVLGTQQQVSRTPSRQTKGKYSLDDFILQRTLGTGSFGRVHLVQSRHNHRFYAIKVLKKAQVVKMKQVEHTNDERRMLQRVKHPFLITLWGTFQDAKNLYMVMDFVEGGELFSLLRKSQVSDCASGGYVWY